MKKLFVILFPIMVLAQNAEDIVKNIDVKKEIEEHLEILGDPLYSPSFYKAYRYMAIYHTCWFLENAIMPYFLEYLKNIKIENKHQRSWYSEIFWYIVHSTHIAIGEVVEKQENIWYYDDFTYCSKLEVKIIKSYKGVFNKEIIPVWLTTCEGKTTSSDIYQWWFVRDTLLLFLQYLPQPCHRYAEKHGDDIHYFPGDFFPTGLICGTFGIKKINGEKRLVGCVGEDLNLPYQNVINILNNFIPICERLEREIQKYHFPLSVEKYAEFMKKRGYSYPLTEEDLEKIRKKFEKWRVK